MNNIFTIINTQFYFTVSEQGVHPPRLGAGETGDVSAPNTGPVSRGIDDGQHQPSLRGHQTGSRTVYPCPCHTDAAVQCHLFVSSLDAMVCKYLKKLDES